MSENLRKIVVGTDFNELAASALRFAGHIAGAAGAELIVVYADTFEPPAEFTSSQVQHIVKSLERARNHAREQLERHIADHVVRGVKNRAIVAEGSPAETIVRIANEENADLIAMGTHGRGGLQRLIVGSVAERVMREAHVPVLTVRSTATSGFIRRILCPVNESETAAIAVDHAARFARALDAELTLLNVAPRGSTLDIDSLRPDGVRVTVARREIEHDDAAADILTFEADGAFDLIVIGAMSGATTVSVTRHARTPVLTVTRHVARNDMTKAGAETHAVQA